MLIDGHEVDVTFNRMLDEGHVILDIEEMDPEGTNWIVLAMTREQAMSLGGLLIGMATADGVPLGDYPDPSAPCDNPGCTQCHGVSDE